MTRVKKPKSRYHKGILPCAATGRTSYPSRELAQSAGGKDAEPWLCDGCYYWHWKIEKGTNEQIRANGG